MDVDDVIHKRASIYEYQQRENEKERERERDEWGKSKYTVYAIAKNSTINCL
jgi:hypothetical protein